MSLVQLVSSVEKLATTMADLGDGVLSSGGFVWGELNEVRMALLSTTQDLHDLAAELTVRRDLAYSSTSMAQLLLAQHRIAYRDLLSLLVGLPTDEYHRPPALGEWPVIETLKHIYGAERSFLTSILAGLRARAGGAPAAYPSGETADALTVAAGPRPETDDPVELLAAYDRLHQLIGRQLISLTSAELELRSPYWESEPPTVRFRIGRLTAHLHEHANQVEKTLVGLGRPANEARLLIRQMYRAMAEVEGVLLDVPAMESLCAPHAQRVGQRAEEVNQAVIDSATMIAAVKAGDSATVNALLAANPALANAADADGQSAVMVAAYHHQPELAEALAAADTELDLFEAAAVGEMKAIREVQSWDAGSLNRVARDGFTPLQLACYFGHVEAAQFLIEHGADVHAVSSNATRIQPIHAAVAGRSAAIVAALIAAGVDVHAQQAGGFTPLQAAEQNGDADIIALLRAVG